MHELLADRAAMTIPIRFDGSSNYCSKLQSLILIVGASRSGSSWVAQCFGGSQGCVGLRGEIDPVLLLSLASTTSTNDSSDALGDEHATEEVAEVLGRNLAFMAGRHNVRSDRWYLSDEAIFEMAMRTIWQWPALEIDPLRLLDLIAWAFGDSHAHTSSDAAMLAYIDSLKRFIRGCDFSPYYYDIPYYSIRGAFPLARIPAGPPNERLVIEEPPFVPFSPWSWPNPNNLLRLPLVLKSPSNSYRLSFFRALFPNARIHVVHVLRHPVSSVTGLIVGWAHHGFFKHRLTSTTLDIDGYSNGTLPWTRTWWKFDLPPGWSRFASQPLPEVCTFQWVSANRHVIEWVRKHPTAVNYIQVRYVDLVRNPYMEFAGLFRGLGLDVNVALLHSVARSRTTMASQGVLKGKRREACDEALRACTNPEVKELCRELKLDRDSR
jgi:hypothetical protein